MKTHTQTFKENLVTLGKEINAKVTFTIDGVETELSGDELGSVTPHYEGNILKSVMKQIDIVSDVDIPLNTEINVQFGMRYDTETYEYIDYGNYIVFSSDRQEDTNNYKIVAYDKMLYAMKDYEQLEIEYPITIRDYISEVCTKIGLEFANSNDTFANYDKEITQDLYKDLGYTYRDILDQLAQVTASTICINDEDKLEIRYLNDNVNATQEVEGTNLTITNAEDFKIINPQIEGNTTQDGTPTPDNPQEVKVVTGLQEVDVVGLNFLPYYSTQTIGSLTITNNGDGSYTLNGSVSSNTYIDFFGGNFDSKRYNDYYLKEYNFENIKTLFGTTSSKPLSYRISTNSRTVIQQINASNDGGYVQIEDNGADLYLALRINNGASLDNVVIKPMLVKNATDLTKNVEPYKGKSYEINLAKQLFNYDDTHYFRFNNASTLSKTNNVITFANSLDNNHGYVWWNIPVEIGKQISISYSNMIEETTQSASGVYYVFSDTPITTYGTNISNDAIQINKTNKYATITTTKQYITLILRVRMVGSISVSDLIVNYGTPTTYAEYFTPIELCKIGTYQDKIYKDNGKWYIYKTIGKVVLNGSESTLATHQFGTNSYQVKLDNIANGGSSITTLSNYFLGIPYNDRSSAGSNVIYTDANTLANTIMRNTTFTSLADFKTWLSTNKPIVYYVLNTPTYTEITNSNYPELLSQLNKLKNAPTYEGATNITSSFPIKFSYATDYETINEDYIKNTKAEFGEKYGPINSIVLSRSADSDNIYLQDEESIEENGLCEIKIKENQIMNGLDRIDYLPDILEKLNGLQYYTNDFESIGIMYLDLCDKYKVKIDDKKYDCVMLNDEVKIGDGLNEIIYTNKLEETQTDYKKATTEEKKEKQTYLMVDKQAQRIDAVVSTQGEFEESLSELNIEVGGISAKVELNYDFVREATSNNSITLDDMQQDGLVELKIMGNAISNTPLRLNISNNVPEYVDLPITTILKSSDILYDTLSIEMVYNDDLKINQLHCYIDKKLDYIEGQTQARSSSNNYMLDEDSSILTAENNDNLLLEDYVEGKQDLGVIDLPIQSGSHTFSINGFSNINYYGKYAVLNNVTSDFALKKHLISEINLTPEEATINADKISLEGKTINLTSENININSDNFKVDSEGNMICNNATINGTIEKTINNVGTIKIGKSTGQLMTFDFNNYKTYFAPNSISFILDNKYTAYYGDDAILLYDNDGNTRTYISGYDGNIQLSDDTSTTKINMLGSTGNITCVSLTQTSLEENKKNIEPFKNALSEVLKTDIYEYNLIDEKNDNKKHLGFVIGKNKNYSKLITSIDDEGKENGVDTYSMISLCLQAIKEQQEEIQELKKQIKGDK